MIATLRWIPRLDTPDGISIASRVGRVWRVLSTAGLMQGISTSDTRPGTDNNQDYRHLDLIIVDSWVADLGGMMSLPQWGATPCSRDEHVSRKPVRRGHTASGTSSIWRTVRDDQNSMLTMHQLDSNSVTVHTERQEWTQAQAIERFK